jgi:hypothetical protein
MLGFSLRRSRWIAVVFLVAVCVTIGGGALYIRFFMSAVGHCETVVRSSIPSPDGRKAIVIFERECGATVPFNTQASIAPAGGSFSSEKNPAFFVVSGTQDIVARWRGDRAVEIAVIPGGDIFRSEQSVGDVEVEYR